MRYQTTDRVKPSSMSLEQKPLLTFESLENIEDFENILSFDSVKSNDSVRHC